MLLNISSDRIIFIDGEERIVLEYGELEKRVPEFLYSRFEEAIAKGESKDSKESENRSQSSNEISVQKDIIQKNIAQKIYEPIIVINGP